MQILISRLSPTTTRLSPGRAVAIAMLLGPLAGALPASSAVAAREPNEVTGLSLEVFYADTTLTSFGWSGTGWYWWSRRRGRRVRQQ